MLLIYQSCDDKRKEAAPMPNKTALLKIILLYLLCFAYIWAMDMAEFVVFASDYHQFVIAEGVLKIIFYMAVILLVYFISQEKTGRIFDLILLFIPAAMFIFSRFAVFVLEYIGAGSFWDILKYIMLNGDTFAFVGAAILCGLILKYVNKKQY